jgi:PST family polysaccharide transporter
LLESAHARLVGRPDIERSQVSATDEVSETIGRQAGRGLRWSLVGNLISKVGSFAMGLVLARLLTPSDFGVFAVALAAMQFVMHVNDVGLIAATVQWRGKLDEMAPTAATMAVGFSVLIYGAFWFAAPVLASVAHVPEATGVVRLLTIVIIIDGITAVRSAVLMREFRQDQLIRANLVGLVVNAVVAISLALAGAGPYAFAGGLVAGSAVTGVLVFRFAAVPVRVGLNPAIARRLMAFGIPLAASLGVEAVLLNTDYIVVGHDQTAVLLGYYLLAFNISTWALSVISAAVRYVSVAGFARLSEVDKETLSAGVLRSVPLLVMILLPIAVLTACLGTPLIDVLYGAKWLPSAPVLPFLMILTVVRVLVSFAMDILMGAGSSRSTLIVNLCWAVVLVPALIIGTDMGGFVGTGIAHAIVALVVALPVTLVALHRIGVRLTPLVAPIMRPVLGGALSGVVAWGLARVTGPSPFVQLLVAGTAGVVVYAAVVVPPAQARQWLSALRRRQAHAVAE